MSSAKSPPTPPADLSALASEALDLWQEHLAAAATDPAAKAEMMKLLEPSRRLFADWTAMMQTGPHATGASAQPASTETASRAAAKTGGAEADRPASDDSALRIAQLAHRVAELEKRLAKLESRPAGKAAKTSKSAAESESGV